MKLNQNTSPVEIAGAAGTPSQFNITASKEAFKILSSGLYANKVRAIIRELSCNARDAHVAAGKADVPFEIHLPTSFEPFFSIKDQGTGLEYITGGCRGIKVEDTYQGCLGEVCKTCDGTGDYDAVKVLYCTYFASDKTGSNLFIGALGLGSKSPFCYTEGFSVTNIYEGVKRIYSCFINEVGVPSVLMQTEEETPTLPNGVEISFPCKQNDVWEFENQAEHVLEFFSPRPIINTDIRIHEEQYSIKNDRWGMRKAGYGSPRAIQGMVQYSIGDIDQSRLSYEQKKLTNMPLDLFFPIGELSVAASRESLSNDEQTILNVLKALDEVVVGLLEDVRTQISACKTAWEARVLIFSMSNLQGLGSLVSKAAQNGEFDNLNPAFSLKETTTEIQTKDYPNVSIFEFTRTHKTRARKECLSYDSRYDSPNDEVSFSVSDSGIFIVNDIGHAAAKYTHWYVQNRDHHISRAYLITWEYKETPIETVVDSAAKIIAVLGNPPVKLLSEIKAEYIAEKPEGERVARKVRKVLFFSETASIHGRLGWNSMVRKADDATLPVGTKYYLPLKNLEPQTGEFRTAYSLKNFISAVRKSKHFPSIDGALIYGISEKRVSRLDDTWVEFTGHIMSELKKLFTPWHKPQLLLCDSSFSSGIDDALRILAKKKMLGDTSPLQQFITRWSELHEAKKRFESLETIINKAESLVGFKAVKSQVNFDAEWAEVKTIYPMLVFVSLNYYASDKKLAESIAEYVTLIDGKQEIESELATYAILGLVEQQENEYVSQEIN